MKADEVVVDVDEGRQVRVWRTNETSWTVRVGVARVGDDRCTATARMDPEDARILAAALLQAAEHGSELQVFV